MTEPALGGTANGSRRRGLLLVGVVFLLGLVCGSALTVIGVRTVLPGFPPGRPGGEPPPMARGMEGLVMRLDLDAEQRTQIREIFERNRGEIHRILRESGAEIRAILTEEQREKFDEMRRHRRPMRRRRGP
jgi:Spy/CpxP family protein refolding chaperone